MFSCNHGEKMNYDVFPTDNIYFNLGLEYLFESNKLEIEDLIEKTTIVLMEKHTLAAILRSGVIEGSLLIGKKVIVITNLLCLPLALYYKNNDVDVIFFGKSEKPTENDNESFYNQQYFSKKSPLMSIEFLGYLWRLQWFKDQFVYQK